MNSTARVLVVDDEKLIRWSVSERLARRGYQVETAESGERALELITSATPDVALLDVRLPGLDGVATLRRALTLNPELVVVMMSAHSTVDVAVEAMKHGAVDFLVKPFPLATLDEVVERALSAASTRKQIATRATPGNGHAAALAAMVGNAPVVNEVRELVSRLAASNATTVLIEGESGSGKEVVARSIHYASARADRPFLQLNCATLPEQLLESELFGHERGAFTDARAQKRGLFENADGGSVMLDEIGDLPAGGQAKLLRLLEDKTFRRVGGITQLHVDVRVIAATNVNLAERVQEGLFRADLFFRLNVVRIRVPPLRERKEDLPLLAAHFVSKYNQELKREVRYISPPALELLVGYGWPGNVRELRNVIERAFILHPSADELRPEHLPQEIREARLPAPPAAEQGDGVMSLTAAERRLILEAMDKSHGNQSQAARLLGISRDTLRYRLKKFGLL
ncbi:MAG: sigma-54-dependent Fis family transcriptional regulator [Myxococcales bacterium]|nr:sigma-54-dependent Fis family transcriptional regulator [Myxococcales bacterium]